MVNLFKTIVKKIFPLRKTVKLSDNFHQSQRQISSDVIIANLMTKEIYSLGDEVFYMCSVNGESKGIVVGYNLSTHFENVELRYNISSGKSIFTSNVSEKMVALSIDELIFKIKEGFNDDSKGI